MPVRIERRRHKRYVTNNTEYHMRGDMCVAVRNRQTGTWLARHDALGTRLVGGLARTAHGFALSLAGEPGASLWFKRKGLDVVTSAVEQVNRPPRSAILHYL